VTTIIVVLVVGAVLLFFGVKKVRAKTNDEKFRPLVRKWASLRNLDPALVWGVMMAESSGNPSAENPSDPSAGLMQTIPLISRAYAEIIGTNAEVLEQVKNPDVSMQAGTGFLEHLQRRYAATKPAEEWVQAYNLGEPNFDKGHRVPEYGARVMRFSKQF